MPKKHIRQTTTTTKKPAAEDPGLPGSSEDAPADSGADLVALDHAIAEDPELAERDDAFEDMLADEDVDADEDEHRDVNYALPGSAPSASESEEDGPRAINNPFDGKVRNSQNPDQVWGTISTIKQGTEQEAVSCFCRLHGCRLLKRVRYMPSMEAILKWYTEGYYMAPTHWCRNEAMVRRHSRTFPEPSL